MSRVTASEHAAEHLSAINAEAWPGVATVPRVPARMLRVRRAEASFAAAAAKAGLAFDGEDADLKVIRAEVFDRLAVGGWIGLCEGYLAGEWATPTSAQLVHVLRGLIAAGYSPKTLHLQPSGAARGGAEPAALIAHYSGDGASPFQGHFATGVPTTQRTPVKSFTRGAGKRGEPARHFVDVTEFGEPLGATREDLADAQSRSAQQLLDAAAVASHTHLLAQPAAGGALAVAAAKRGATVDCVVPDPADERLLSEAVVLAGVEQAVSVGTLGEHRAGYDAAVSAEYIETLPPRQKVAYLRELESSLSAEGRVALQTVAATGQLNRPARAALQSLRAYIWPGLSYSTPAEISQLVDRHTGLRVIAESHAPRHLANSLALQRATFDTNLRDAAADGFDPVYRRLWTWQLALREALAQLGMLDLAQVTLVRRHRGGRR